jgi:epidermal growth factor receptor
LKPKLDHIALNDVQAFWIPPNEKTKVKIPVAVKVLQDFQKSNDLLDEARIMSSVRHSCCIRIIAISMTAQVKLVTQLMPLGCLLDYVQRHKELVGPTALLNWASQIADVSKLMCVSDSIGLKLLVF